MKYLILVRHGEYGLFSKEKDLLPEGVVQIKDLAKNLDSYVSGHTLSILNSTATRCRSSAKILEEAFHCPSYDEEVLNTELNLPDCEHVLGNIQKILSVVDTLILVTHAEYVRNLPSYIAYELWSRNDMPKDVEYGCAVVIDMESRNIIYI